MKKLSFVIPCYGSEDTIICVLEEIQKVVSQRQEYSCEIICINDCSPDNVLEKLISATNDYKNLIVIDLAKNMGKHAAVMAGYAHVSGDLIVTLDDDGQCPADKLWLMVDKLDEGYDTVMAKYPVRKQSALKNLGSKINNRMSHLLLGKPKDLYFSNFSVSRRFLIDEILCYRNPYPYLEGLVLRVTHRIGTVDMEERERFAGRGAFTFRKSLSLWLNGFTAFSVKPLRIASILGTVIAMFGFIYGIVLIVQRLMGLIAIMGFSSTLAAILFIGGILMMMQGLVGEYVGRIYISINNSPQYVIRDIYRSNE